jgi:HK97 family phage prohead protease
MSHQFENAVAPFEFKFTDTNGQPAGSFEGYAAAFNNIDDGGDRILPGAFVDTLAQAKATNRMPKMLLNHGGLMRLTGPAPDDLLPIGKWSAMAEDTRGLESKGRLINLDTESGKRIYGAMKEGELDSLSMGYKAVKFVRGTRAGEPKRTLSAVKLFEVSPVTFPMNKLAAITGVKGAGSIATIREFEDFLRDVGGYSAVQAKLIASSGFKSIEATRDAGDGQDLEGSIERLLGTLTGK